MLRKNKKWPTVVTILVFMLSIDTGSSDRTTRNLLSLLPSELKSFLDSFDTVITDFDGVLWNENPIDGVKESISKLKAMGKKVHFVTNNSGKTKEITVSQFNDIGVDLNPKDLIYPSLMITNYLKSQNFTKKVFVIGRPPFVQHFQDSGIQYITARHVRYWDTKSFLGNVTKDEPDVGGVVMDIDLNFSYFALSKAITLLKNLDVKFLVGAEDKVYKRVGNLIFPGNGYFTDIIKQVTGRSPMVFGKPSETFRDAVFDQFQITDPKKVLFVGDSLVQDMGFASLCGFQKLFVLSGGDTLNDALNTVDLNHVPDYWINSLGHLKLILD